MRTCWLTRTGQPSCLLFFAGWGMDPAPFSPLAPERQDLLLFYDYRELDEPDPAVLLPRGYQRLSLLAWSMGVWVAGHLLAGCRQQLSTAVAVNGTLTPIDDRAGIPALAFEEMLATFSPQSLLDFYASMFGDQAGLDLFLAHRPERPVEEVRAELAALRAHYLVQGPASDIYSRHLVGSRDRIFAARAQVRCWGKERCRTFQGPHFPFYDQGWAGLLKEGE
jgi:biotin synthesis protein BioG